MMAINAVSCAVPQQWATNFSQCLFDWQGLEAGTLALIAAGVSIWWIKKQIGQTRDLHAEEISRRHNAARAVLPLALASLTALAHQMADQIAQRMERYWEEERGAAEDGTIIHVSPNRFDPVTIPQDSLASLRDFVETVTDKRDVRHVAELTASLQILVARYNDFDPKHAASQLTFTGLMLDAAKVRLLIDKMYNYARFVSDDHFGVVQDPPDMALWDEIHKSALGLIFFRDRPDDYFEGFKQQIRAYKSSGVSPWNEKFGE